MEEAESLEAIVRGLTDRVRTLVRAMDRLDRLETAGEFAGWLERECERNGLHASAEEVLLRALRIAGDAVNFGILRRLDSLHAIEVSELMEASGLERVAVSERVNDLVQTGLATRELIGDQIRGTALSAGLVAVVELAAARVGEMLVSERAGGAS